MLDDGTAVGQYQMAFRPGFALLRRRFAGAKIAPMAPPSIEPFS
jgi:hypothetical protein